MTDTERRENKAKTAKGALLGYALMIDNAKNTPFYKPNFSTKPEAEEALQKAYTVIGVTKRKLEGLVSSLDSDVTNTRFAEKVTRGHGVVDKEEKGTTIGATLKTLNFPTNTARKYLSMLTECHTTMQNLLQDKVISVYHADFLVRTIKELFDPSSVFCQALNQNRESSLEEKRELKNTCRVMSNIGAMIKNQPYVKLRSLVCDMFGTGAVREFEGNLAEEGSFFSSNYDRGSVQGLDGLLQVIGNVSDNKISQQLLDYSDGMSQALREVFQQIKNSKTEVKGLKEAIAFLNNYSTSVSKTAQETKDAVAQKEAIFKRTTKGITDAKLSGKNFLPVAGIGQVLNPLRYQNGQRSQDLQKIQSVLENAYDAYRGWQGIQNRLLTSARVLCGFARNRSSNLLEKQGGDSWFRDAMEKISYNNIKTAPKYKAAIDGSLEELCKVYFAVENESSKMKSLPIALLSDCDEIKAKVQKRTEIENKVAGELKALVVKLSQKDFAGEIALALKDATVPVSNFHKIKSNTKGQETPNKIATSYFLKFCKALYVNTENGRSDESLRLLLQKKIKEASSYNNVSLRICEMCGFVPSNIGQLKGQQEYIRKSPLEAYQAVVEELSREDNAEALNVALGLFEDYKPWQSSYEKEVAKQVEKRKTYEIERAIGWQEVLKETCALLCPSDEKSNYKEVVTRSANIANVLVSSLLADAILKDAGYRDKTKINSETEGIARRLWDRTQEKAVAPSPAEDVAIELFLEPLIKREYEIAVSKMENILTKGTSETIKEKQGSAISFVNNGGFIDFDEDAVMESLGQLKEYASLREGSRGNIPLETYANAKMKELIVEKWLPEEKYAHIQVLDDCFNAKRQKELFETLLGKVQGGSLEECSEILEQIEQNNPFFCLMGAEKDYRLEDIREEIRKGNANIESMIRESRWADSNAQFSERMGGTSDAVKLAMSQRALDARKKEIEEARAKSKRFEHIAVADKSELIVELVPSVCKVFCSEIGYLVGKDITDGEEAIAWGLQVARSKEVLERGVVEEHRSEIITALAEYVNSIGGIGEYEVKFQTHIPTQIELDQQRKYEAKDVSRVGVSAYEPDILYQLQNGRSTVSKSYGAFLEAAKVQPISKGENTYSKVAQKQVFGKKGGEAEDKIAKGMETLSRSEEYIKDIEKSSPAKTYAQSLAKQIREA